MSFLPSTNGAERGSHTGDHWRDSAFCQSSPGDNRAPRPAPRTKRRNWSGCSAMPIRGRQTARRETTPGQAAADPRVRCWPQAGRFCRLVPAAQDVARFGQRQFRTGQRSLSDGGLRPFPFPPRVDPGPRQARTHRRLPSRPVRITALKMLEGGTLSVCRFLRSRTPCSQAPREGRDAIRSNSQRRNSCMDWRCTAARAASSSRTSWGTPLMVICTDMNALCHRKQRYESSSRI